jgi:hypothetical protein
LDKIDQETFKENINKVMLKRMVAFADQEAFDTFATATLSDTNEKAIDLKKNNLPEIEGFDYADYDSNKDGYIDKAEFSALFDAMELSTLGAEREDQQDTNLVRYTVPGTDEEVIEIIHPQAREFPKMLEEVFGTEENPKYDDEDNNLAAKAIINYLQKKDGVYTLQFQTSGVASSATGNMVTNISNNESSITPFVFIHEMVHEMGGADFNELLKDTQYAGLYGERTAFDELAEMDPDGEGDKEKSSKDAYHFGDNPGGRFLNDAIEAELKYDNWHSIHLNGQIATTEMMNELSPDQWRDLLDIAEAGIYTPNEIGQMLQNTTSYEIGYAQIMNSINS